MNLQEITLKSLAVETNGTKMSLEQIDQCFHSMKEGGIILYQQKKYIYVMAGELLCALHQNGDITDNVLSDTYHTHCSELMNIEREKKESEIIKYIDKIVREYRQGVQ